MGVPQEYWNKAYCDGIYLSNWDYEYPSQELIGVIAGLELMPQSKILDLGCGGGRDAIYLAQQGFSVSGIDLSSVAIQIANKRANDINIKVDWHVGNVLDLPFKANSFEMITDRACFHHIDYKDRPQYAKEVFRALKIGGFLLLRGSYQEKEDSFFAVTDSTVRECFGSFNFHIGRVLPIVLANNSGRLGANIVLLRKVTF